MTDTDKSALGAPFELDNPDAYGAWRSAKLGDGPKQLEQLRVSIRDLDAIRDSELAALTAVCRETNFVIFRAEHLPDEPERALTRLGERLGLRHLDRNLCAEESGLTALSVHETATDKAYIPYTNRPLSWHTDGYYNDSDKQIHGWLLYCEQDAAEGGENEILDPEIAYIRLRDRDPELIRALMADDAFTIPANQEGGEEIRPDQSGPVFSVDPESGKLHMRYSARKRNVIWKDNAKTREAAEALTDLFSSGDTHIYRYRLQPGEGILSNNALHRRTGFRDDPTQGKKRLIYRARYYDRVDAT